MPGVYPSAGVIRERGRMPNSNSLGCRAGRSAVEEEYRTATTIAAAAERDRDLTPAGDIFAADGRWAGGADGLPWRAR